MLDLGKGNEWAGGVEFSPHSRRCAYGDCGGKVLTRGALFDG